MEIKTTDGLMHAKPIKDTTKRLISHINDTLKHEWKPTSKLYHAGTTNDITTIKSQYKYAVEQGKKAKRNSVSRGRYFKTTQQLYKKFALQFINKAAHLDSSFQMLSSRLYNVGSKKSNQPILSWSTSKKAFNQFFKTETHYVHEFSGQSYNLYQHPNSFKANMKVQFSQMRNYVNHHHWHKGQVPSKLFVNHSVAMRMLGVSDQHYYDNAVYKVSGKHIHAPKGLYNISGKDMNGLALKNAFVSYNTFKRHLDNYSSTYLQNGTGEDLKDGYLEYTHQMQHSTTNDFHPTIYGKYAKPSQTIHNEYKHIKNIKSQRFGTFFDKYPKYAHQLNLMSGRQGKRFLKNRNNGIRQDMSMFSHLGLWSTAKRQLADNLHKYQHLHVSQVYKQSDIVEYKQHVTPLNKQQLLRILSNNRHHTFIHKLNNVSHKHYLTRPFSANSTKQKGSVSVIHTKSQHKHIQKHNMHRHYGLQR